MSPQVGIDVQYPNLILQEWFVPASHQFPFVILLSFIPSAKPLAIPQP